jgi:S-formylglutathione hydrolase FrmB
LYIPPEAGQNGRRLPVLFELAPWTSAGRQQLAWQAFRESLPDRLDRLISSGQIPPAIVVCPDLYTYFGGSQYVNSAFLGRHADFLVDELIPHLETHYPVIPGPAARGAFGRSSGGFGALRLAMDYPETFAAIACHSGDLGFDTALRRDMVTLCQGLARYDGDVSRFVDQCLRAPKLKGSEVHLLMLLGLAATYSPDPHRPEGFALPVDLLTGELIEPVWQQWLAHDPVVRVDQAVPALKKLSTLYIDCGSQDQFWLHYGARQLHQKLTSREVSHIYEEFNDNHSGTAYRYDESLPRLLAGMQTEE